MNMDTQYEDGSYIGGLLHDHASLVMQYFNASLKDRTKILIKLTKIWRDLKAVKATNEAHIFAVNHAVSVKKLRRHWYIARG